MTNDQMGEMTKPALRNQPGKMVTANNATPLPSTFEGFGTYYQEFVGYPIENQLGDRVAFSLTGRSSKASGWEHPLAKTGLLGVGSLAATLLVGFSLSEEANPHQPAYTFRDPGLLPQVDVDTAAASLPSASLAQPFVSPSPTSIEFSNSLTQPSVRRETLPWMSIPHTPLPALGMPMSDQDLSRQTQTLKRLVDRLSAMEAANNTSGSIQARPVLPSPLQTALAITDLATAEAVKPVDSQAVQTSERLPAVGTEGQSAPAQPSTADASAIAPTATPAPADGAALSTSGQPAQSGTESTSTTPSSPTPLASAPLPSLTPTDAPASLEAIATIAPPETQRPNLFTLESQSQSAIQSAPSVPIQAGSELSQIYGHTQLGINRAIAFRGYHIPIPPLTLTPFPVDAITPPSTHPTSSVSSPTFKILDTNSQAKAAASRVSRATPVNDNMEATESRYGIRYFLDLSRQMPAQNRLSLLALTHQAAIEVAQSDQVEYFRVFHLHPLQYQRVWAAMNGNVQGPRPTPAYGFIDYQRHIIVTPSDWSLSTAPERTANQMIEVSLGT